MNVEITIVLFWIVSLVMAYSSGRQDGRIKQKIEDTKRLEELNDG